MYYKVRPKNCSTKEYLIVECNLREYDFYPSIEEAIHGYENKLRREVEYSVERLAEEYKELKEFLYWKENKDE